MPNPERRHVLSGPWLIWRDLCATGPCTAAEFAAKSSRNPGSMATVLSAMCQRGYVDVVEVRGKAHQRVYRAANEPERHARHGGSQPARKTPPEPSCALADLWPMPNARFKPR